MRQTWWNFVPMGLKSTGQCHNRFGLEFLNSLQRNVQSGLDTLAAPSKPIFETTTLKKVIWLVVLTCFDHLEKYESQLGWLFPIYGKIIQMFQTTNQNASRPLLRRGLLPSTWWFTPISTCIRSPQFFQYGQLGGPAIIGGNWPWVNHQAAFTPLLSNMGDT